MNNEEQIIAKMKNMLGENKLIHTNKPILTESVTVNVNSRDSVVDKVSFDVWLQTLPPINEGQFLLDIDINGSSVIFCVQELDWQTAMNIDMKSFRATETHVDYYSEEYERRNTLSRAIIWVADSSSQVISHNKDGYILERVQYDVLDALWSKYKAITGITTQEAQKLYESTRAYLNNAAQEGIPIPPIIPETIAICDGWCTLSLDELRKITAGDWERMQIIRMARTDLMGIYTPQQILSNSKSIVTNETVEETESFDARGWANQFPAGHPNRPPGV